MDSNADRFLAAFNSIEKAIKHTLQPDKHVTFSRLLDMAKKKNPIVSKNEIDLKEYAELRNAIIHDRTDPYFIIAEPHIEVVKQIESIRDKLINPEKIYPKFARKVLIFQIHDPFSYVLGAIKKYAFTQFPVYEGDRFVGLLSESGISRFLANTHEEPIAFTESSVEEVMKFERHSRNVVFMDIEKNLYEAKEVFLRFMESKMSRLDAVLITKNGKKEEPVIGIITPCDVIAID